MSKLPENVTPLRRRKGRKTVVEQGVRLSIHITTAQRLFLEQVGHGNVSKGIRELVERAANYESEHEQAI